MTKKTALNAVKKINVEDLPVFDVSNYLSDDEEMALYALDQLGVDKHGLDDMDRRILKLMFEKYQGGPVGIETMASALGEEAETLEEVYEPYLIQEGFLQKTLRGRVLTDYCKQLRLIDDKV